MRVFLIMPRVTGRYGRPSAPPVGMAYLMSYLRSKGHNVKVLDLRVESASFDYVAAIKKFKPDLVGVSLTSCNYKKTYSLIDAIKRKTNADLVIGGPHVSVMGERALKECKADYAVYGEGENALLNLAGGMKPKDIKSLIWRDGINIHINPQEPFIKDLDSLSFPEYEFFDIEKYADRRIPITTARGCPHMCVYCAVDLVIGRRFRPRSPGNVVDEIEYWYKKGYRNFGFNDSTFTENVRRAEEICDELVARDIKIKWDLRTGIRVDRISKNLFGKLKKAGCDFVAFGIESVDPHVLKLTRKGTTPEQAQEAVDMAKQAGLGVGGFFMIGNPGDSYKAFRRSYEFAKQPVFDEVRFYSVEPYPGTDLYEWIQKNARFIVPIDKALNSYSRWSERPIFESDDFPEKDRIKAFNEGEQLVAGKLFKKVLGPRLGSIFTSLSRVRFIRKFLLTAGFKFSSIIFNILKIKNKSLILKEMITKKKILIVTSTFPSSPGDAVSARFVLDLARALTTYYSVHVLTPQSPDSRGFEEMEGVKIHRFTYFFPRSLQLLTTGDGILANIKKKKLLVLELPFLFFCELLNLIRIIKREKIDVVNTHWIIPQGFAVALLKRFLNIRHILTVHSAGIFTLRRWGRVGRHIGRFIMLRTDIVMPVAGYIKETLDELIGRDYNFKISPMGVDMKLFSRGSAADEASSQGKIRNGMNLLFVGKMVEKKGLKYLLKAISLLKEKDRAVKLKVVGGGPLEEELKRYSAELNLNKNVSFLGWLANEKLPEIYNLSDIVVVPSVFDGKGETEGMPVVVLEAMAMSRPVLASRISGIPDIVKDDYNGWLVDPGDAVQLKDKIAKVLNTDLREYRESAYKTAARYDLSKIASAYKDSIESLGF
ncbi:MAG: glycosyltransferase [Candidatus Omnitrophota bacterium]